MLGIPSSLRYFYPRGTEKEKRMFISQTIVLSFLIGFLLFIIFLIIGGPVTSLLFHQDLSSYMFLLGAHAFFILTSSYLGQIMILKGDIKLSGLTAINFTILDLIFMSGSVIITGSVTGLMTGILIASFIKFIYSIWYSTKKFQPKINLVSKEKMTQQIKYGIPLALAGAIGILNVNIDKFFISFYFTTALFAVYSVGALFAPVVRILLLSISDVMIPEISLLHKQKNYKRILTIWHESIRKTAILYYPLFVFLFIVSNALIIVFFTSSYTGATEIFMIYLFLLLIRVTHYSYLLSATGNTKYILKVTLIGLGVNIILSYILIETLGFSGPAIASVIVTYIMAVLYMFKLSEEFHIKMKDIFPWKVLAKICSIALLTGIITFTILGLIGLPLLGLEFYSLIQLPDILSGPFPTLLIATALYLVLYLSLAKVTNIIKKEDWRDIMGLFGIKKD
jgi:O-antigen/teichoic acid export membrane protein